MLVAMFDDLQAAQVFCLNYSDFTPEMLTITVDARGEFRVYTTEVV